MFSHTLLHPSVFSDVNGEYQGFDFQPHQAVGYTHYTDFSGWDIYRTEIPLLAWIFPAETSDMMQSLVNDAAQGGALPRWVVDNIESGVMESGSATPLIAGAYAFGAQHFDAASALQFMKVQESTPGVMCQGTEERWGLRDYLSKGFLPVNADEYLGRQTVAMALEFNLGDFALAQFASSLGDTPANEKFMLLAQNWKNLFNPATGYLAPKNADGSWWIGFDAIHGHMQGYTEGNATQYSFLVPYDLPGLFQKMGGNSQVVARLDRFFSELNAGQDAPYAWMGNEPSIGIPFYYNSAGVPARTQALTRKIIDQLFMQAVPGADDLGTLSAWAVWASIGMYPLIPGVSGVSLTTPYFPQVIVHREAGDVTISSAGQGGYISSLAIDGKFYGDTWIPLSLIGAGTQLNYTLNSKPTTWGTGSTTP
jgi:predicted alpha-1,2-mannosidase